MKKITELTETRWRTVYRKDIYGNRERDAEEYIAFRNVKSIKPGPRFGHFFIDLIFIQILFILHNIIMIGVISLFENNNTVEIITLIFQITLILLIPSYYILCEYKWQQTIGKLLTKTVVIDEYGNKPDLSTILLRSLIRLVPLEAISCYGDKFSHGWHDRWSKTWVVSKEEVETLKKLQAEQSETK